MFPHDPRCDGQSRQQVPVPIGARIIATDLERVHDGYGQSTKLSRRIGLLLEDGGFEQGTILDTRSVAETGLRVSSINTLAHPTRSFNRIGQQFEDLQTGLRAQPACQQKRTCQQRKRRV